MKKFFLLTLLAPVLWSCTANDPGQGGETSEAKFSKYVSVNVISASKLGNRADEVYENGTSVENKVSHVRFFFFNAEGKATPVWENKGTGNSNFNSYLDWYPAEYDSSTPEENDKNATVEKVLNATLGLVLPEDLPTPHPAQVIAVLNPSSAVLALNTVNTIDAGESTITVAGPSIKEIQATVADFRTGLMGASDTEDNDGYESGNFVMSNSVYVENGNVMCATTLKDDNFQDSAADAEANAITIYVERVLARLDFCVNIQNTEHPPITSGGSTLFWVGNYTVYNNNPDIDAQPEDIYVRLLGWNVTGTSNISRLLKEVNPAWTPDEVFGEGSLDPWNSADYHRSFWAVNPDPESTSFEYLFGNFNGTEGTPEGNYFPANGNPIPTIGANNFATTYLQENANAYNANLTAEGPEYPTQVIIAAQLVNAQGTPFPMCEWAHYKYTYNQLIAKLLGSKLSQLYKRSGTNGAYTFTQIEEADITFKTGAELGISEDENEPGYYVYPVLSTTGEGYTWTDGNAQDAPVMSTDEVNTFIRDAVNHVKIWNNGWTYYFFDIKHLGNEGSPGYYGIVRNHIYRSTLASITGLGTPVYKPDQVIYPEQTDTDASIVIADIKILQWRVVSQVYNLDWQ